MTKVLPLAFALIAIVTLFLVFPVNAAINTILPGNTVFIGEQGLDVSSFCTPACQIGWWAAGAALPTSSPTQTYSITTPTNFFVSPTLYGSYPGSWYVLPNRTSSFIVADPQLGIRVEDTSVSVEVTNGWVYRGDSIGFRIDSNLNAISQRPGGNPAPVTIYVQSPTGGTYTALIDSTGNTNSIVNIPVTSNPTDTGSIWSTANPLYPAGTYTIWVKCDVNGMWDNYPVTGKTISTQVSLRNQEQNPLINANVPTTNTPPQSTTVPAVTTTSATTTPPVTVVSTSIPPTLTTTAIPKTASAPVATGTAAAPTQTTSPGFDLVITALALIAGSIILLSRRH